MKSLYIATGLLLVLTACHETTTAMYPNAAEKCDSLGLVVDSLEYNDCLEKFKASEDQLAADKKI